MQWSFLMIDESLNLVFFVTLTDFSLNFVEMTKSLTKADFYPMNETMWSSSSPSWQHSVVKLAVKPLSQQCSALKIILGISLVHYDHHIEHTVLWENYDAKTHQIVKFTKFIYTNFLMVNGIMVSTLVTSSSVVSGTLSTNTKIFIHYAEWIKKFGYALTNESKSLGSGLWEQVDAGVLNNASAGWPQTAVSKCLNMLTLWKVGENCPLNHLDILHNKINIDTI